MRIFQILEATYENLSVLEKLTNVILKNTPVIPKNSVKSFYVAGMNGFDQIYKEYENNEKFKRAFSTLETTRVTYVNDPEYDDPYYGKNAKWGGYHDGVRNHIVVFAYNYSFTSRDVEPESYAFRHKISKTLVHELRHLFQYAIYPNYFHSRKAFHLPYEERNIEVDASWSDILGSLHRDEIINGASEPKEFTDYVMNELKRLKRLSPSVEKHYRRKTIAYLNDYISKDINNKLEELLDSQKRYYQSHFPLDIEDEIKFIIDDVIFQLQRHATHNLNKPLNEKQLQVYRKKIRSVLQQLFSPQKREKKIKEYIAKYEDQWREILENYLGSTGDKSLNVYSSASEVAHRLESANREFFYTENKTLQDIAHEVRKYFYKRSVEVFKYINDTRKKNENNRSR